MTLQAVLWDMDGTLVDSEPVWVRVQIAVLAELGATWTAEDAMTLVGSDLGDALKVWMARLPAGTIEPEVLAGRIYGEVIRSLKEGVELRPGALELLTGLKAAGIPCALVSASYRTMIEAVLSHLPPDLFDVVVAGDEVRNGKPHPEPYLTAAAELGVDPVDCVVIEDSPGGTKSGTEAGAFVVAVPQWVTIPAAPRRLVVESLEPLTPDALRDLLR
jgi:HAD superfamily hydrolase (TIGR01509 family)